MWVGERAEPLEREQRVRRVVEHARSTTRPRARRSPPRSPGRAGRPGRSGPRRRGGRARPGTPALSPMTSDPGAPTRRPAASAANAIAPSTDHMHPTSTNERPRTCRATSSSRGGVPRERRWRRRTSRRMPRDVTVGSVIVRVRLFAALRARAGTGELDCSSSPRAPACATPWPPSTTSPRGSRSSWPSTASTPRPTASCRPGTSWRSCPRSAAAAPASTSAVVDGNTSGAGAARAKPYCYIGDFIYKWGATAESSNTSSLVTKLEQRNRTSLTSFQGCYRGTNFTIE